MYTSQYSNGTNNNTLLNTNIHKQLSIEDLDETLKQFNNNSGQQPYKTFIQQPNESTSQDNEQMNSQQNSIDRINSRAITDYVTTLNRKIHELSLENEELKINFVQVSEMLEVERESYQTNITGDIAKLQSEIKLLQTNNELLQKEKERHLVQNSIEKEQNEMMLCNYKKENEQMILRIKSLNKDNETLRKECFNTNIKLLEANKIQYENEALKEELKQLKDQRIVIKKIGDSHITLKTNNNHNKEKSIDNNTRNKSKDKTKDKSSDTNKRIIRKTNNTKSTDNINKIDNSANKKDLKEFSQSAIGFHESKDKLNDNKKSKIDLKYKPALYEKAIKKEINMRPINKTKSQQCVETRYQNQDLPLSDRLLNPDSEDDSNIVKLKQAYNDYAIRLNSKECQNIDEEDLKQKMRMIMETIESQKTPCFNIKGNKSKQESI